MKTFSIKLLYLFFIFSSAFELYAQDIELHMGEVVKSSKRESINILGKGDDGLVSIKTKYSLFSGGDVSVDIYNSKMNLLSSNEIELPDKDLEIENFLFINSKIYLFMSKYDKDKNINTLYGTVLSKDAKLDNDIIEIVQVEVDKKRNLNYFSVSHSEDSTSFLVSIVPTFDDDKNEKISYIVLDHNFKELDNIFIEFPFNDNDFLIYDYLLDRFGNIHLLGLVSIEETRRKTIFKTSVEREARLFSFYKGEDDVKEYKLGILDMDEGFLSQIKMRTDNLGKLQCSGFYSDNKGNSMKGIFVFTLNVESREIDNISSQEFTEEYIEQFLSDRQIRKKERKKRKNKESKYDELYNFKIRDLVMKKGGGFYVVAEYYYYYVTTTTDSKGNTRTTHHYVYKDLMVINVLKTNEVTWFTRIPKYQHSTNDGGRYSGIAYGINSDNSLNIIFNDHRDNASILSPEDVKNSTIKRAQTVLVTIDTEGNATKTPLMSAKESKTVVMPKIHSQCKPNDIVLYAALGRKNRFINIILR